MPHLNSGVSAYLFKAYNIRKMVPETLRNITYENLALESDNHTLTTSKNRGSCLTGKMIH